MASTTIDEREMEDTRIARFAELEPIETAFVDSLLPNGRKQNLKVIGRGVVEATDFTLPINVDHGFTLSWVRVPPGGGGNLHSHRTNEVFIPIDGPLTIFWGETGEHKTVLQPRDCISVPVGLMRGFRNDGASTITMLAMVCAEDGGGSVTWHSNVLREAAEKTGLGLDESGKLVHLPNFDPTRELAPIDVHG